MRNRNRGDGERGERKFAGKAGKRVRNCASDMLEGQADGKGVAGRMLRGEGNKTHGTRLGRKTRTEEISRASIRLLFLP